MKKFLIVWCWGSSSWYNNADVVEVNSEDEAHDCLYKLIAEMRKKFFEDNPHAHSTRSNSFNAELVPVGGVEETHLYKCSLNPKSHGRILPEGMEMLKQKGYISEVPEKCRKRKKGHALVKC